MRARIPQMYYGCPRSHQWKSPGLTLTPDRCVSFHPVSDSPRLTYSQFGVPLMPLPKFALLFLLLVCGALTLAAQDRSYGRSVVATKYGIVATSQMQASQAGARMLERGGSAIDAAIAANAVLGVVEPMMNGIGGDLFAIYWDAKSGKLYGLNSSGWAPQGLTLEHMKAKGMNKMPLRSIDTVTVPGAVAGWNALHGRFGKLPWKDLLQ